MSKRDQDARRYRLAIARTAECLELLARPVGTPESLEDASVAAEELGLGEVWNGPRQLALRPERD